MTKCSGILFTSAETCLSKILHNTSIKVLNSAWLFDFQSVTCPPELPFLVLSTFCISQGTETTVSHAMSQVLLTLLNETAHDPNSRKLKARALYFIGHGWKVWQQFINPFTVIESLLSLITEYGFLSLVGIKSRNVEYMIMLVTQSLKEIILENSTLLMSILSIYARSVQNPLDCRIAAVRL